MSIGEPRHAPPRVVLEALERSHRRLDSYPATAGMPELRAALRSHYCGPFYCA